MKNKKRKHYRLKYKSIFLAVAVVVAVVGLLKLNSKIDEETRQAVARCEQEHTQNYCFKMFYGN